MPNTPESVHHSNGHIRIPTETFEALCRVKLPGETRQVLDAVIRKTLGWNKSEDTISLAQISELTGLHKRHIIRARDRLEAMNIVPRSGNGKTVTYRFNTNHETWVVSKTFPDLGTFPDSGTKVPRSGNKSFPDSGTPCHTTDTGIDTDNKHPPIESPRILAHLNEKRGGRGFKPIQSNLKLITSRLKEGYTEEELATVIDYQAAEVAAGRCDRKWLNPMTLFRPKNFERYLVDALEWKDRPQPAETYLQRKKREEAESLAERKADHAQRSPV